MDNALRSPIELEQLLGSCDQVETFYQVEKVKQSLRIGKLYDVNGTRHALDVCPPDGQSVWSMPQGLQAAQDQTRRCVPGLVFSRCAVMLLQRVGKGCNCLARTRRLVASMSAVGELPDLRRTAGTPKPLVWLLEDEIAVRRGKNLQHCIETLIHVEVPVGR